MWYWKGEDVRGLGPRLAPQRAWTLGCCWRCPLSRLVKTNSTSNSTSNSRNPASPERSGRTQRYDKLGTNGGHCHLLIIAPLGEPLPSTGLRNSRCGPQYSCRQWQFGLPRRLVAICRLAVSTNALRHRKNLQSLKATGESYVLVIPYFWNRWMGVLLAW